MCGANMKITVFLVMMHCNLVDGCLSSKRKLPPPP